MTRDLMLTIPGGVVEAVKLPPDVVEEELLQELAIALYERKVLSLGKAQELAQMTRWEFEEVLGQRRIPRHYTEVELEDDSEYAQRDQ